MSEKRTHRPIERYWPYVEKPEEPTAEELAALDPDLHETLFGPRDLPFSITVAFPPFEGDNYQQELDRSMWNSAASFARSVMLATNLYRVQGQLMTPPRPSNLKAGG